MMVSNPTMIINTRTLKSNCLVYDCGVTVGYIFFAYSVFLARVLV